MSAVTDLFQVWSEASAKSSRTGEAGDVEAEMQISRELVALPATSLRDFAAKLVAVCDWCEPEGFLGDRGEALLAEARALVAGAATEEGA